MNEDYYLLDEALQALKKSRAWAPPDFYKANINPVVMKIQERLASIEAAKFIDDKRKEQEKIEDLIRNGPSTIPNSLDEEVITNFGLFKDLKK